MNRTIMVLITLGSFYTCSGYSPRWYNDRNALGTPGNNLCAHRLSRHSQSSRNGTDSILSDVRPLAKAAITFALKHPLASALTITLVFPKQTWAFIKGCFSNMIDFAKEHAAVTALACITLLTVFEPTRTFIVTQATDALTTPEQRSIT